MGKTYVLVHGAFHGGWCWRDVADRLRALGHVVYTPTQTGLGERSHLFGTRPTLEVLCQDIEQVLRYEDLADVILVGHSFGGCTVSVVADRMRERLRHLVYVDANLAEDGEASLDVVPPNYREWLLQRVDRSEGGFLHPPQAEQLGIKDPAEAASYHAKLTRQPLQPYLDKLRLRHPLGNGLPVTFIDCTKPRLPSITLSRERARNRPDWNYVELPSSHNAMAVMPRELTDILAGVP